MPLHQPVTNCLRGGKVSRYCGCNHCNLAVCSVCGAYEGSLTTDCPGERVDYDKQQEVYTTMLDYVDGKGWHQSDHGMRDRPAHFALTEDQMAAVETAIEEANPAQQWELRAVGAVEATGVLQAGGGVVSRPDSSPDDPPIGLDDLERRANRDVQRLDGLHGDPSRAGGWIGHRDYARALVLLIPRLRAAESRVTALETRQQELLQTIVRVTNETPFPDEIKGWEAQRAAMVTEVGSLRARVAELERAGQQPGGDKP